MKRLLFGVFALLKNPIFKIAYVVALFGWCIYYFFIRADKLHALLSNAAMPMLGLVFCIYCCTRLIYVLAHYYIYRAMNVDIAYSTIFKIVCLSLLGRYIPGKIWSAGNYYLFSREAGIQRQHIGLSFMIVLFAVMFTGSICSIPLFFGLWPYLKYLIIIFSIIIGILLHPKVLNWILSLIFGILQKYRGKDKGIDLQVLKELNYHFYLKGIGLVFLNWIIGSFVIYFTLYAFEPIELINLPICLSAAALSQMIGILAVFAPAGIGVKEGVGITILSQIATVENAFLTMATIRIIGVIVELSCGLISAFFIKMPNAKREIFVTVDTI